jgi:hypothetical protein
LLTPESSPITPGIGSLIMGLGMGLMNVSALVLIQGSVEWKERGSATASNVFSRNLGSTLGASVFGAVLNYGLLHSTEAGAISSEQLRGLLNGSSAISATTAPLRLALQDSLHTTFVAMLVISLLIIVASLFIPAIVVDEAARPAEPATH